MSMFNARDEMRSAKGGSPTTDRMKSRKMSSICTSLGRHSLHRQESNDEDDSLSNWQSCRREQLS